MNFLYFKTKICFICLYLIPHFFLQGLILSNALRAQKNAEDEGCTIALNNLRSEVIELRNEGLEKDKILNSLVNKIKEDEVTLKPKLKLRNAKLKIFGNSWLKQN
jgi:cytochrome c-type biogenesis protein CcmH/NrfF